MTNLAVGMRTWRVLTAVAAGGLVLGPALDQIHVQTSTLAYAHPWWLEQAWWVGPQFAVAFVVMFVGVSAVAVRGRRAQARVSAGRLGWQSLALLGAYAATGIWHEHPWRVAGALAGALIVRAAIERFDVRTWLTMLLLAAGGCGYEAALSSLPGTFTYADPSLLGVPASLALLYMHAAPAIVTLVRTIER